MMASTEWETKHYSIKYLFLPLGRTSGTVTVKNWEPSLQLLNLVNFKPSGLQFQHEAKIVIFNYYYYYYYYDLSKIAVLPEGRDEISQFLQNFPQKIFKSKKNSYKNHPNLHFKGF